MEIPFERWYEAIFIRRSRRQFINKPLPTHLFEQLKEICLKFKPFNGVKSILINQSTDSIFRGAIGKYGRIKNAPLSVAFIGNKDDPYINEKVGYTGEGIILEATAMGLSTCWVAGFFRPQIVAEIVGISNDERVFAVSPIGYSSEKLTFEEKIMTVFGKTHKRKPLSELIIGFQNNSLSGFIKTILDSARLAPSAVNRQPWRFTIESDGILVSTDNTRDSFNISKRLDCGIAMLHIEVASLKCGIRGHWQFFEPPKVAKFFFNT
ncbi:MAG: nitroreductase family protein [Thermodesulfovibrionales bacterium]|nr:nitroreductase family protein [Thermodesulfovibrionales bacterium]